MAEVPLEMNASRSAVFSISGIRSESDNCERCIYAWFDKDYSLIQLYIFLYQY